MLPYDKYAKHNFLSVAWSEKLRNAGIDMKDASYYLYKNLDGGYDILSKTELELYPEKFINSGIPTYTLPELIFKLNEFPFVGEVGAPLEFIKDAPFYIWCYYFNKGKKLDENAELPIFDNKKPYIEAMAETPIESAAAMLILSKKYDIGYSDDMSDKYDEDWWKREDDDDEDNW